MHTKRRLIIVLSALAFIGLALLFSSSGEASYRAEARILIRPYTNIFFARSFESDIVQTMPDVIGLRVTPSFSAIPSTNTPVATNGAFILIRAVGATTEEAQRAANEAARNICQLVLTNYGFKGEVVEKANTARSYSYFHDTLKPTVSRLFKR